MFHIYLRRNLYWPDLKLYTLGELHRQLDVHRSTGLPVAKIAWREIQDKLRAERDNVHREGRVTFPARPLPLLQQLNVIIPLFQRHATTPSRTDVTYITNVYPERSNPQDGVGDKVLSSRTPRSG